MQEGGLTREGNYTSSPDPQALRAEVGGLHTQWDPKTSKYKASCSSPVADLVPHHTSILTNALTNVLLSLRFLWGP